MNDDNDSEGLPPEGAQLINLGDCPSGGHHVVAVKDDQIVGAGTLRPVKEGQPLPPDSVFVTTDKGVVKSAVRIKAAGSGPAQVASPTYRNNFDRIFGAKKPSKELN